MTEHYKLNNFSSEKKKNISVSLFLQTNTTANHHSNLFPQTFALI